MWEPNMNWKVFWGENHTAKLLHYQGLKPSDGLRCFLETLNTTGCPPIDGGLLPVGSANLSQQVFLEKAKEADGYALLRAMLQKYDEYGEELAAAGGLELNHSTK